MGEEVERTNAIVLVDDVMAARLQSDKVLYGLLADINRSNRERGEYENES